MINSFVNANLMLENFGEIELIEPELWFRRNEGSALMCATAIQEYIA